MERENHKLSLKNVNMNQAIALLDRYQNVLHLTIINCPELTDEIFKHMGHLRLQSLTIINCSFTGHGFVYLYPTIKSLIIDGDYRLNYLPNWPLQTLALYDCPKIKDQQFSSYDQLQNLTIHNNLKITDQLLVTMKKLQSLNLKDCWAINNQALVNLPDTLTNLSLTCCHYITDEGLAHIPKSVKQLILSNCWRISDFGLYNLKHLDLEYLSLADSVHLTHSCLGAIEHIPTLDLTGCPKIGKIN